MDTRLGRFQASSDEERRGSNEEKKDHNRLFLSRKSIKAQLQRIPYDSEKVEDLRYQPNGTVAKKRQAQKTVASMQSQLDALRVTVDRCCLGLSNFTKLVRTDVTDGFGGFLFEFLQKN